jgi:hypothetical protein
MSPSHSYTSEHGLLEVQWDKTLQENKSTHLHSLDVRFRSTRDGKVYTCKLDDAMIRSASPVLMGAPELLAQFFKTDPNVFLPPTRDEILAPGRRDETEMRVFFYWKIDGDTYGFEIILLAETPCEKKEREKEAPVADTQLRERLERMEREIETMKALEVTQRERFERIEQEMDRLKAKKARPDTLVAIDAIDRLVYNPMGRGYPCIVLPY